MTDILIKQYDSADREEFKRPDHPDFLSSQELQKMQFSGVRQNSIAMDQELWILGEVKIRMSHLRLAIEPGAWEKEYAKVFGLHHVETMKGSQ